jgi:hypothetical protein
MARRAIPDLGIYFDRLIRSAGNLDATTERAVYDYHASICIWASGAGDTSSVEPAFFRVVRPSDDHQGRF